MCDNYFSVIPTDALNTIWKLCDAPTRYGLLLKVFGIHQGNASDLVDQIMVYNGINMIHNDGTIAVNSSDIDITFRKILEKFGSSITRLELRFRITDGNFLFFERIRIWCPNIRSLYLPLILWDVRIEGFLAQIGANLEVLELESGYESATKEVVPKIAANCANLKTFCFTGKGIRYLNRLYESIGDKKLVQVSLRSKFECQHAWEACLGSIKVNCRQLNSLALSGPNMCGRDVSDLLISYGGQLKEAVVSQIDVHGALDVATACGNLRRCIIIEKDADFRRVKAFGSALAELFLHLDMDSNTAELAGVSAGCPDLERLVIECKEHISYVPYIFGDERKKARLKVLELNLEILRVEDLDMIAESTGNLLSMSVDAIGFEGGLHTARIFEKFARSNPGLLRLSISISMDAPPSEGGEGCEYEQHVRFAGGIADAFRRCRSLQSIQISNRKHSMCFLAAPGLVLWRKFSVYHHRRVFVSLFGNRISPY